MQGTRCIFLLALIVVANVSPGSAQTYLRGSRYGFNWDYNAAQYYGAAHTNATLDMAAAAGLGWIRIALYWNELEPIQGQFNFDSGYGANVSQLIDAAAARGIAIYGTIKWPPKWATGVPINGTNSQVPLWCGPRQRL